MGRLRERRRVSLQSVFPNCEIQIERTHVFDRLLLVFGREVRQELFVLHRDLYVGLHFGELLCRFLVLAVRLEPQRAAQGIDVRDRGLYAGQAEPASPAPAPDRAGIVKVVAANPEINVEQPALALGSARQRTERRSRIRGALLGDLVAEEVQRRGLTGQGLDRAVKLLLHCVQDGIRRVKRPAPKQCKGRGLAQAKRSLRRWYHSARHRCVHSRRAGDAGLDRQAGSATPRLAQEDPAPGWNERWSEDTPLPFRGRCALLHRRSRDRCGHAA